MSAFLTALWILASCTQSLGPEGEAQVSDIEVYPQVVTLLPSADTQFVAIGMTAAGDTGAVAPEWFALNGGSIDASGRYTAPSAAGQYQVMALVGAIADTAAVTVSSATLSRIEIIPTTVTVAPGGSATFRAIGIDSNSDTVPVSVFWTASGGTITQSGFWTAPTATGTYDIQASNGQFDASAVGTVAQQAPSGSHPNEPAGFVASGEHAFQCIPNSTGMNGIPDCPGLLGGNWQSPTNSDWARVSVEPNPGISPPMSGPSVVQHVWPTGIKGAGGNGYSIDHNMGGAQKPAMYVHFWVNVHGDPFSADFEGGNAETKLFYTAYYIPNTMWLGLQGTTDPNGQIITDARFGMGYVDGDGVIPPERVQNLNTSKRFQFGTWEEIEVLVVMGDLNGRNGEFHVWLDGVKVMQHTDLHLRGSSRDGGLFQWHWAPIYGGANTKTRNDVADLDHVYISYDPNSL